MTDETAHAREVNDATVMRGNGMNEAAEAHGRYVIRAWLRTGKSNGPKRSRISFALSAKT